MNRDHVPSLETLNAGHRCKGIVSKLQKTIDKQRGSKVAYTATHTRREIQHTCRGSQVASHNTNYKFELKLKRIRDITDWHWHDDIWHCTLELFLSDNRHWFRLMFVHLPYGTVCPQVFHSATMYLLLLLRLKTKYCIVLYRRPLLAFYSVWMTLIWLLLRGRQQKASSKRLGKINLTTST